MLPILEAHPRLTCGGGTSIPQGKTPLPPHPSSSILRAIFRIVELPPRQPKHVVLFCQFCGSPEGHVRRSGTLEGLRAELERFGRGPPSTPTKRDESVGLREAFQDRVRVAPTRPDEGGDMREVFRDRILVVPVKSNDTAVWEASQDRVCVEP